MCVSGRGQARRCVFASHDTRAYMAKMAIAKHYGRRRTTTNNPENTA